MTMKNFENNNASLLLDTGIKYQYDNEINCHSGRSFLCHSGPRAGIQSNDNLMPKAFRTQSGRFPFFVSLGRSETKTRGSIVAQSGRSMVEILGTLAIIGVLSIGGIMGYSYGMDKWRANTTINDINLRAIDLLTQKENGQELNLDQWGIHSTVGYEWGDYGYVIGHDAIDMSILGIPQRVCEMIIEGLDSSVSQISINSVKINDTEAVCNDDNDMTFYYGNPETCGENECSFETICLYGLESGTKKKECREYGIFKCTEIDGEEWCSIWTWMHDKKHIPNWYHADKICGLLGKRMPTTDELWDSTTNVPTNLMNELKNKGFINTSYPTQIWTATQVNSTTAYMVSITSGLSQEPKTRTYHSHMYIAVCHGN